MDDGVGSIWRVVAAPSRFDVVGDFVVMQAEDFTEPIAWYDGKTVEHLGTWDPLLAGETWQIACLPGAGTCRPTATKAAEACAQPGQCVAVRLTCRVARPRWAGY
jgi:hypothetical protein